MRASGLRADSGSTRGLPLGPSFDLSGVGGASCSTTWAFVPAMPNALTPARARPLLAGQVMAARGMARGSFAQGTAGVGGVEGRLRGGGGGLWGVAALRRPGPAAAPSVGAAMGVVQPHEHGGAGARRP